MNAKIRKMLHNPAASGILIFLAAVAAMAVENSAWNTHYNAFLDIPVSVQFADLTIAKPLLLWINDGLMAVFFLLVGLELKREFLEGELSQPSNVILPVVGAVGGIALPAAIYTLINQGNPAALDGWAIPTATDIAFALGILALLGKRVPASLKLFLLTLAIIDDLAAILIIAFFYTSELSPASLMIAGSAIGTLILMNRLGVTGISGYMVVGIVLWIAVLKSGVHATLAGVVLGFVIPLKGEEPGELSPLHQLEDDLHHVVGLGILPLFAFANAGVSLQGLTPSILLDPVPLGIALGLFLGKQIGVFGFVWLSIKSGLAKLPEGFTWKQLYGVALLCGVGFTMSLFISSLAFEHGSSALVSGAPDMGSARLGILTGSILSGIFGYILLRFSLPKPPQ
ncbi:sodium/proton antiporter, NhaA family [Magnetococcus marinus MC-1]|uniref:Na(+)/H(+) antiporter NhaA 2 n=1 Tax=Magnetococcus marinus (strain ATCC BAA-1437 / JCM 17883 / MC-1) TaxID=156889 RepID=NHAA2_MAGMM|nr:Na+/H+ antiporter NhaA [Magnetococcus marinus]A0L9Y5.1 RecName: Full=Na(+)/H(+) antiporter NhaA 2; AltName: Full=Sodium/proton antiporter NhaA 2 [Magnetococcus marinus MC-1]ABK44778.1 sodium/proton antiporter, NhaA family [Magnetococcus marinus MC-1]